MISLSFKAAKEGFFDRAKVINAVGRADAKALKEIGRLIRKAAQKSLKYAAGPSAAGSPPHVHKSGQRKRTSKSTGKTRIRAVSPLREFLFFSYDKDRNSVVVGPVRLAGTRDPHAPANLEYGGSATITRIVPPTRVASRGGRAATPSQKAAFLRLLGEGRIAGRGKPAATPSKARVEIRPRPFMDPALKAEEPGFAAIWKDSVR